jgi:DNA polymerase-3 subunit epsilon
MFGLKKFLAKGGAPAHLSDTLRAAVESWRQSKAPALDDAHFHIRYVVVDIASSGLKPETDELLGIAAAGVEHAGIVLPDDAGYLDFAGIEAGDSLIDRKLMAFLQYTAKAPLVTYHVPYVGGFLQRAYKERLGIDFQPQWVDLAWLLPSLFEEKSYSLQTLDHWLDLFGLGAETGRRDAMENTLLLARVFQMLLVRANGKGIDTAAKLVDESRASSFLRRTH